MASNSLGTTNSNDIAFLTLGKVPTVTTVEATNTTPISAQLNAIINANYFSTTVSFEYGTSTSYGNTVAATQSPVTGNTNTNVSSNIIGLTGGITYHFRVKAVNSFGTAYGTDKTFIAVYAIGGNVNGGIIFYIDGTGQHGLVCAPTDQVTIAGADWGCYNSTITGADGTALGTGNQNTIDIVNGCLTEGIAAKICYDLDLNGYTDWYLPSKDELDLMYTNLKAAGLSSFSSDFYWSSSEYSYGSAWLQDFRNGTKSANVKFGKLDVRAVRSF